MLDAAMLLALGVRADAKPEVLGTSSKPSESEVHWRAVLTELKDRGLHGVKLFVSDDHAGLKAARKAVFPVPWQRWRFHLPQNAGAYVPRQDMRKAVAAAIRDVFNAPDIDEAKRAAQPTKDPRNLLAAEQLRYTLQGPTWAHCRMTSRYGLSLHTCRRSFFFILCPAKRIGSTHQ